MIKPDPRLLSRLNCGAPKKSSKNGDISKNGWTIFLRLTVEMLTTQGVTFAATVLKAFWVERMSDGTSLTGASASPALRFDSKKSGESLFPEQPARQQTASEQTITFCIERSDTFIYRLPEKHARYISEEAKD
jgi:hypothetical protein